MSVSSSRSKLLKKNLTKIKNNLKLFVSDDNIVLVFENISPVKMTF